MSARIGLVVPSSNVTMETELPELFGRHPASRRGRFTFHSARMRMTSVTPEALALMDGHAERCATELADAECDVLAHACLVAVMVQGAGAHRDTERRLQRASGGRPVVSSAGALVDGIRSLRVDRVAMITPYAPPLTARVVDYLAAEDIEVVDAVSLGVTDNAAVGRLDPAALVSVADGLDIRRAEAIVVSACVQMPSLPVVAAVERRTGLPTLSAATATARSVLATLGLPQVVADAGSLLSDPAHPEKLAS